MDALEELRGFLDNDQFVSFKWLSVFLDINVEKSKVILEKFKSSNSDVSATYCISGQLKNKQQSISVVSEKNLAKCREMFEHINCTHIYSLQKTKLAESVNVPVQLNTADVQQGNEQSALQPTCVPQLLNSNGGVRLDGNEIKPVGKRAQAIVRVISTSNKSSTSGSAERSVGKAFSSASNNSRDKSGTAALSSSSGKDISTEKSKDKSKSAASAFFANTASSTAEKIDTAKVTKASTTNVATSSTAEMLRKTESAPNDDDDEWTEEGAASYKPDKAKLQTRKVVRNATITEESTEVLPAAPLIDDIDDKNTRSVETKKAQLHVHGAMDDYMEDVAIEQFNAGQASDVNEPPADGKRTKRKLVEKMFGDAKGYLITEMVWEDVTDDEEAIPARSSAGTKTSNPVPAISKEKKAAAELDENDEDSEKKNKGSAKGAPAAKKAKKAAPIVQQKGMMSFFGKK